MKNNPGERKTKVLFVITKSNWGGAQKYVYEMATGLDRNFFEPVVALGGRGELTTKLHEANIRVIRLPSLGRDVSPLRDYASFHDLLRVMRDEHPDAVHLNSSKVGVLGSIAARAAGIPRIIFTAHGWAFNEDRFVLARIVIKIFSFLIIRLSDVAIAVSKAVAKDSPAWGIRNKVVTLHLPAPPEEALVEKELAREHFLKKAGALRGDTRLWVGIVAELHKNKGLIYAIRAMRDINIQKNVALIIIGSGEEEAILRNQIRASDLEDSVFLMGFEPDAAKLMPAFDIFLLPSTTEAFGYVLLEAGFANLPVVASRVGGIPEIIEDNETGLLVTSRDSDSIRSALSRLIASPDLREKLGSALHSRILRDFSPQMVISKTAELYKKTV